MAQYYVFEFIYTDFLIGDLPSASQYDSLYNNVLSAPAKKGTTR